MTPAHGHCVLLNGLDSQSAEAVTRHAGALAMDEKELRWQRDFNAINEAVR